MTHRYLVLAAGVAAIAVAGPPALAADLQGIYASPAPGLTPAPAGLFHAGTAEVWVGARSVISSDDPDDNTHAMAGGNLFASMPLRSNVSIQGDVQGDAYFDSNAEASQGILVFGGHLSYREPSHYLIGAFAGFGRPFADDLDDDDDGHGAWGYVIGGEGQVYVDRVTLYGQAGFGNIA